MADSIDPGNSGLASNPILPTLPEIQTAGDATALLKTPPPVIAPVIPSGIPENINTNTQLQGDYRTGPNPGAKPANLANNSRDYAKAIANRIQSDDLVKDEFKYGRQYSYGAGYKNQNFERYYKHDKFKQLGFSPYRDNDAIYNEKGSWWDDFNRMRGEWDNLAWSGFKSIWGSEETANEEMERGMAVGSSTRGGFGGSVINFGLNSAYTVGIIGELALEDVALAAIEAGTMGTATGGVVAAGAVRNSMAFGRLTKAWEGTSAFLKSLKNAETAKNVFNAAKAGEKITDFAKFMNPLQRSMEWTTHLARGTNGVSNLSNMAKVTKTFGNFYRDLRELNVAHSEARLEGEGAASEYQNKLIDEFYTEKGRMPNDKEAQDIYDRAQSVKASVTLANDLTIYATNKLVFDDLFEGFRPGTKLADAFLEGTGRFLKRTEAKAFKAGETAAFSAAEKSTGKKVADFLTKSTYVPWSRKYMVGNLGEALQENSQEIIRIAAQDYQDRIQSDPTQLGFYGTMASIGKGTSEQFSGQGLETFLSGYMMGSLIQGGGKGVKSLAGFTSRGAKAAAYATTGGKYGEEWGTETESQRAKKQAEETDNDVLNAANFIAENALIYGGHRSDIASAMKLAAEAKRAKAAEGDEKGARDMQNELQLNHFDALAKSGNMGLITEHVNDMMKLEDQDLQNAYNNPMTAEGTPMTAEQIRAKLQGLKNNAEGYQRAYDKAHKMKPNPYNPWMFNPKKQPEAYLRQLEGYMAHERALSDMIFANETYTNIAERMSKMGAEMAGTGVFENFFNTANSVNPIANAIGSDISILVDKTLMSTHLKNLDDQIKVYSTGTAQEQKKAKELEKTRDLLKEWRMQVDRLKSEMRSEKGENAQWHIEQMHDVFKKYVEHIAKTKNGFVFTEQMNKGFNLLKDFIALDHDKGRYVHTINRFSDPNMFDRYTQIQTEVEASSRAQRIANLQKALDNFAEMAKTNKMLNEIFDLGLFVMPEDVERLKAFTITDFYNAADKSQLSKTDPKYKQAVDIIEKYAEEAGQMVSDKDIEEAGKDEGAKERSKYSSQARPKFRPRNVGARDDRRGYRALAQQFGFDPKSTKSTVEVEKVLNGIINSEYATMREKALARRLLTVVKPGQVVTFVSNLSTPGVYKADTKETIVDARYSSEDYTIGKDGHPIEHVILHELLHSLTVDALATDPEFKTAITSMLLAVKAYQNTPEFKAQFGSKPLYGSMNEEEFIAEALTNDTFQSMLRMVPYQVTGKPGSAWEGLVDAISKMLRKLMGVAPESSVLDEALHIITAKIDGKPITRATAEKPSVKLKAGDEVSQLTPISEIKEVYPALYDKLVKEFRGKDTIDEAVRNLPEAEFIKSDEFKDFMLQNAALTIANFNAELRKETNRAPGTKGRSASTKKELVSNDEWNDFQNTNTVSDSLMSAIADRIHISGVKALTERESNIYDSRKAEIDTMLAEKKNQRWAKLVEGAVSEKELDAVMDQIDKAGAMSPDFLTAISKKRDSFQKAAEVEETTVSAEQELRNKITDVESTIQGLNYFLSSTDSHSAGVQAQKDLEAARKELEALKQQLAQLQNITEVQEEKDIDLDAVMNAYANITSVEDMTNWKKQYVIPFMDTVSREEKARLQEEYGKRLNDHFRELEEQKKKALAENLDINTLDVGTIVLLNDQKSTRVVAENTGESVTLVSPEKFNRSFTKDPETGAWSRKEGAELEDDQKTTTVPKAELKDKIFIKNSEFKEMIKKTEEPTPEQVQESQETLVAEKERTADETAELVSKAIEAGAEANKNAAADLFKKCQV